MNVRNVYLSVDVALVIADCSLNGTGADGSDVEMSGNTADVARRAPDGWKKAVDNPSAPARRARSHGLLRRKEVACLTVKVTSFPERS
jgi:ketosteroid isomerase-like protein